MQFLILLLYLLNVQKKYVISTGYDYPIPSNPFPPQLDEPIVPPQIIPTYLPPNIYPPVNTPIQDIQPPQFDDPGDTVVIPEIPQNQYIPPQTPSNQYLPPKSVISNTPQVRVLNMSCLDGVFFRTSLQPSNNPNIIPILEDGLDGCITRDSLGSFRIDVEGSNRMRECGIRRCDNRICATVRLPTVSGLLLPEDDLVALQCTPQQSVVSHTKQVRISAPRSAQGRAAARGISVASGGSQRRFDTQIALLRRGQGSDDFDQPILPGSSVNLGEELLLRAIVRDGDGWRFSRMGAVVVRSASSPRSVTLIDENGCRPFAMRSICPEQPRRLGPLVTSLPMRAFLFQGATPGADNMLLTVRMLGCINSRDCYQARDCTDDIISSRSRARKRRNTETTLTTNKEYTNETSNDDEKLMSNWESSFEFKVIKPNSEDQTTGGITAINPLIFLCLVGLFCTLACVVIALFKFKKPNYY